MSQFQTINDTNNKPKKPKKVYNIDALMLSIKNAREGD